MDILLPSRRNVICDEPVGVARYNKFYSSIQLTQQTHFLSSIAYTIDFLNLQPPNTFAFSVTYPDLSEDLCFRVTPSFNTRWTIKTLLELKVTISTNKGKNLLDEAGSGESQK